MDLLKITASYTNQVVKSSYPMSKSPLSHELFAPLLSILCFRNTCAEHSITFLLSIKNHLILRYFSIYRIFSAWFHVPNILITFPHLYPARKDFVIFTPHFGGFVDGFCGRKKVASPLMPSLIPILKTSPHCLAQKWSHGYQGTILPQHDKSFPDPSYTDPISAPKALRYWFHKTTQNPCLKNPAWCEILHLQMRKPALPSGLNPHQSGNENTPAYPVP